MIYESMHKDMDEITVQGLQFSRRAPIHAKGFISSSLFSWKCPEEPCLRSEARLLRHETL